MKSILRVIRGANAVSRAFSGALLLIMTVVLFLNIVARNLLGYSYIGAEAVGTYLMVWLTFIGAAFIVPAHGHVSVDLLLRAAGPRLARAVVVITALVGMVTSIYMAVLGIQLTQFIFSTGQVETTLNISTGYLYLPVGIGMLLMFVNYAELLAAMLRRDDSRLPHVEGEVRRESKVKASAHA
jgi:TRAP-type C4-dicarboxylate transport system permease small subunit